MINSLEGPVSGFRPVEEISFARHGDIAVKCIKCGSENESGLSKCASCGADLPQNNKVVASLLSGIGDGITALFGVELKRADRSLEEQINKTLAEEREKIQPSREDIDWFSWVTKDNNPIHRLTKRAQRYGFRDIPLMGAHIAAYGEQFVEGIVRNMRDYWDVDIKIIGQENRFKKEVHPGDRILWQLTGFKNLEKEIRLTVVGSVNGNVNIEIISRLGKEYRQMPQLAGPIREASTEFLLEEDHLEAFYSCVCGENSGDVPNMLPAAYVPATLLSLLEQKTQTMEGINYIMSFDFLKKAKIGMLQVDIFPPRKPKSRPRIDEETGKPAINEKTGEPIVDYIYKFRTIVSQNTKPVTYGEITSATPFEIKF